MTSSSLASQTWGLSALPPELRNRIYRLALGDRVLYVSPKPHLENACFVGEEDEEDKRMCAQRTQGFKLEYNPPYYEPLWHEAQAARPNIGVMYASRMTYEEAAPIFYGSNEFHFRGNFPLHRFINQLVPPRRIMIRHVTLKLWMSRYNTKASGAHLSLIAGEPYLTALTNAIITLESVKAFRLLLMIDIRSTSSHSTEIKALFNALSGLPADRRRVCMVKRRVVYGHAAIAGARDMVFFDRLANGAVEEQDSEASCDEYDIEEVQGEEDGAGGELE